MSMRRCAHLNTLRLAGLLGAAEGAADTAAAPLLPGDLLGLHAKQLVGAHQDRARVVVVDQVADGVQDLVVQVVAALAMQQLGIDPLDQRRTTQLPAPLHLTLHQVQRPPRERHVGTGEGACLPDIAEYLSKADVHPTLKGRQSVITHTIGFTQNIPILEETAQRAGGQYLHALSPQIFLGIGATYYWIFGFDTAGVAGTASTTLGSVPVAAFMRIQQ